MAKIKIKKKKSQKEIIDFKNHQWLLNKTVQTSQKHQNRQTSEGLESQLEGT